MWILVIMYVLLIPGVALFVHSKHKLGEERPLTVALKAACTIVIVLAAIIGTAVIPESMCIYAVLITAGLTFGLVGDVVICQKAEGGFLSGMVYFALGHICYIAAFLKLSKHAVWALLVFVLLYLPLLLIVRKLASEDRDFKKLALPVAIYGAIIAAMVGLAATMPFSVSLGFVLLAGAVLFAISDSILAYGLVREKSPGLDTFGLYCYFIGQSLFALSIYVLC